MFGDETAHGRLRHAASVRVAYTRQSDRAVQTVTARLDNATDMLYRNHLNYLKDVVPEIGRAFRLVYAGEVLTTLPAGSARPCAARHVDVRRVRRRMARHRTG